MQTCTQTSHKVRDVAMLVLTRGELANDEIAASACDMLDDEDPMLRQRLLRRLGCLMKESRSGAEGGEACHVVCERNVSANIHTLKNTIFTKIL